MRAKSTPSVMVRLPTDGYLFEPDILLPVQHHLRRDSSPIHRLTMAVVAYALRDLQTMPVERLPYRHAWHYFFGSSDPAWPFTFANAASVVGLDVEATRAALRQRYREPEGLAHLSARELEGRIGRPRSKRDVAEKRAANRSHKARPLTEPFELRAVHHG